MATKPFSNDTELIAALRRGEPKAFAATYEMFVNQLFYFVNSIVKNEAVAEDITSESFMKAYRKKNDFPSLQSFKSFIMVTARNASVDFLRSLKGHESAHNEIRYLSTEAEIGVEQVYIASELLRTIYAEIENLPTQCREVIRLSLIEGRSVGEIADIMNIAYKSVQNQKTKGMQLLRNALLKTNLLTSFLLCL